MQHLANSETAEVSYSVHIDCKHFPLLSCSYNKSHELLCASDCVELKCMPEMGRCIAATRDILPGEPSLLVDSQYVS